MSVLKCKPLKIQRVFLTCIILKMRVVFQRRRPNANYVPLNVEGVRGVGCGQKNPPLADPS